MKFSIYLNRCVFVICLVIHLSKIISFIVKHCVFSISWREVYCFNSNSIFNRENDLDSQYSISLRCYDLTTLYIIVDSRGSSLLGIFYSKCKNIFVSDNI